ncbi:hypothetical protein C805_01351 [Eubacterium sp. 14-2]|uniref:metallophosphoesterase n=1 Tax=Eubacterium sp. 14-2 TaxID=1235790 RepID=UPI00033865BA|nr:metallophosphoesterase [Eubacterium sp. 14-2]EOT27243.1 hypothetical protein C805_01351 [Eubacterium sp. 14-2]
MKVLFLAAAAVLCCILWQRWELTRFRVTEYQISSSKIREQALGLVIADLHGFTYGKENKRLLEKMRRLNPDIIFIPGDMLVSKYSETYETALKTLKEFVKIAPVYYSYGNHESRLRDPERINHPLFQKYMSQVKEAGVTVMETGSREIFMGGNRVQLSALELELDYYEKGRIVPLEENYLKERLPDRREDLFRILLAHNPAYAEEYIRWGADVTFCGHNHGGLVRIPGIGSVISPQLTWFPKYDAGRFQVGDRSVIVSRGLGTHTFHIRIFNRAELLAVKFLPENGKR